jgi:hypothetical protein
MRRRKLVLAVAVIALLAVVSGAWAIPPYIAWMSPPDGSFVSGWTTATVTSWDWAGEVLWVEFYGQMQWYPYYAGLIGTAWGHDAADRWSVSTPTQYYPDGPYWVWAVAHDDDPESNQTTPVTMCVDNSYPGPSVQITAPSDGTLLEGVETFAGQAWAAAGLSHAYLFAATEIGGPLTLVWDAACGGATYASWSEQRDVSESSDDRYWLIGMVTDVYDRVGWSSWVHFKLDDTPPEIHEIDEFENAVVPFVIDPTWGELAYIGFRLQDDHEEYADGVRVTLEIKSGGNVLRTLLPNYLLDTGEEYWVEWDGLDDYGYMVDQGDYDVVLTVRDACDNETVGNAGVGVWDWWPE